MSSNGIASRSPSDLPSLPSDWTWTALSHLVDSARGICYGIVQPGSHQSDGVPMVNSGDILNGQVSKNVVFKVSRALHEKYGRSTIRSGELLVTLVGANFGRIAIAPPQYRGFNCARPVGIVPVIEDAKYVMFAMQSPTGRTFMDNRANTTAQPTLNLKDLAEFPIPLAPKRERQEIGAFLSALDDRIALLRETNATLEAIAQALFKSWFVDFDPVRAKQEGRAPEGMNDATAALFPDSLEESEVGFVPKGWRKLPFTDTVDVIGGGTPKTSVEAYWNGDIPWFSVVDAPSTTDMFVMQTKKNITKAGLKNSSTKLLAEGATIISARGTVGRLALVGRTMTMNQSCYALRGKASDAYFTYFSTYRLVASLKQRSHGSVFDTITTETMKGVYVIYPTKPAIDAFERTLSALMNRVKTNLLQSQSLTELRDTLLPRLISGQLRLPRTTDLGDQLKTGT